MCEERGNRRFRVIVGTLFTVPKPAFYGLLHVGAGETEGGDVKAANQNLGLNDK